MKLRIRKLLLWSQKYTKADMVFIARGGFWVGFSQSINSILSLVLIVAFANLLPKETYGTYAYILSIAGILNIFTLSGMNNAVSRAVAQGEGGSFRTSITYQLKWNMLMFFASVILGTYYFIQGDTVLAASLTILGVFTPLTLTFNTYGAYLDGKKEFKFANISSVLSTFVYSLGMLCILFITDNIVLLIAVYALTIFIPSFIFYLLTIRKFNPPAACEAKETLAYGRTLTYIKLLSPITSQIDKIILAHFWGAAQLAIYSLAMAVPNRAMFFIKRWVGIGFAKFSEKSVQEINKVFYRRIFQGMFVGGIAAILYAILSPYLFKLLLPQYLDSIYYSQLLSLCFIFAMPNRYVSLLFTSQKQSYKIFKVGIINSLIAIFLYISLGLYGGILGLIYAQILYAGSGMLINIYMWRRA